MGEADFEVSKAPAWLEAKLDQRLALMREKMGKEGIAFMGASADVVLTTLTEPPEDCTDLQYEQWDKCCDNCGRYSPGSLVPGHIMRMLDQVKITFILGVCEPCRKIT